ncbi:transposase [Salininema proteolyticum]|uniref:Transposase n=1 Tax=Salininema proteolyticum TaxID=1607685 RepID=A0ABV8TX41_9ACTN
MCAFDGTELDIADSTANRSACGTHGHGDKQAGYPHLRLVALVACGTRSLLGAAFGTIRTTERDLALVLFGHLDAGMLVLLDRGFAAGQWFSDLHATGADFLARVPAHWKPGTVERLHDGSRLVLLGGLTLRLIEAEITIATAGGKRTGVYRLATTLVDPDRFPALDLIEQYLHRWEIETAYSEPFRAS